MTLAAPAIAAPVRVFVVGASSCATPRRTPTTATRCSHWSTPAIRAIGAQQPGVLDIASQLQPRDPSAPPNALIVFPEDVGLAAGLIGSRGEHARSITVDTGGSTAAFVDLLNAYKPQVDYYTARYPGLGGLAYLFLGATDTYYRAFYETFRDLARTYGVYVAASVNAAPAHVITADADAERVALLRDPDEAATRSYAYEAVAATPVNTLFVFAPSGEVLVVDANGNTINSPSQTDGVLRGSLDKAYLTEIEQFPLGLAYGAVRNLDVLDTPVGRLASVTSKDAWMIDVNDRYDAKHPQLVIQPEAFDSWAFQVDPWLPDGFKAGGFAQVQRNPSFLFNLTPCLVGNLYDVTFDGQGAVIGKRRKSGPDELVAALSWIGQNPDSGFLAVAPWAVDEPSAPTLSQRREELVGSGVKLLPGSGVPCMPPNSAGACENGYRESVLQFDLTLPDGPVPSRTPNQTISTAFAAARFPTAPPPASNAIRASLHAAPMCTSSGRTRATASRTSCSASATTAGNRLPCTGSATIRSARSSSCGPPSRCGRTVRSSSPGRNSAPSAPTIAGAFSWRASTRTVNGPASTARRRRNRPGRRPRRQSTVAWSTTAIARPRPAARHLFQSRPAAAIMGTTCSRQRRADRGRDGLVTNGRRRMAARRVPRRLISATSFWDIYMSRSRTGRRFETNRRIDDAGDLPERIHDHPALAVDSRGTLHAVWADRRRQEPDTDIRYARSTNGGRHFSASIAVDRAEQDLDPDTATPSNQWHPAIAADGDDVFIAWQDNRLGDNDIFFARSRNRGAAFDADERVDDSGNDPSNQYRPDIAVAPGQAVYVTWDDERFGPSVVAVAGDR
jgi:hypothetical protein